MRGVRIPAQPVTDLILRAFRFDDERRLPAVFAFLQCGNRGGERPVVVFAAIQLKHGDVEQVVECGIFRVVGVEHAPFVVVEVFIGEVEEVGRHVVGSHSEVDFIRAQAALFVDAVDFQVIQVGDAVAIARQEFIVHYLAAFQQHVDILDVGGAVIADQRERVFVRYLLKRCGCGDVFEQTELDFPVEIVLDVKLHRIRVAAQQLLCQRCPEPALVIFAVFLPHRQARVFGIVVRQ